MYLYIIYAWIIICSKIAVSSVVSEAENGNNHDSLEL